MSEQVIGDGVSIEIPILLFQGSMGWFMPNISD
jgi:hypothetical protein